jgi:hypothetical protein
MLNIALETGIEYPNVFYWIILLSITLSNFKGSKGQG